MPDNKKEKAPDFSEASLFYRTVPDCVMEEREAIKQMAQLSYII